MKTWGWMLVLALVSACGINQRLEAAGLIIVDEAHWVPPDRIPPWPPPLPGPRPPRVHPFAPLELESIDIKSQVKDQVATTRIQQEFFNPNATRIEGSFLLPLPKGAQIDSFSMWIDGKEMKAELLSGAKARQIYEDIVRRSKDPALLEFAGQDLYRVRVFPIEGRSRKKISVSYTQLLPKENGLVRLELGLKGTQFSASPPKDFHMEVEIDANLPIKTLYSPTHSLDFDRAGPNRASARLKGTGSGKVRDLVLYYGSEKEELGINLLTHRRTGEDGFFLLLLSPGIDLAAEKILPKDVVFVIDTSGSMAGKKMEQARKALLFCLENLGEKDRFEIIRFSTETESLFGRLEINREDRRARARSFVEGLKATGGTAIDAAMQEALAGRSEHDGNRPRVVVFITDGRPTVGTVSEVEIVERVKKLADGQVRVFCFGVGSDVNTHLLDKITEYTRAYTQYVLPEEDLEIKVSDFFAKVKEPVLASPDIRFKGVRATRLHPSPLPDVFRGSQLVLAGRYEGKGDCVVELEGKVSGKSKSFTYELTFPEQASENSFIPRLWATRRVGYLLDQIRLHGENAELKDEITDLARQYGIVTPYTAYLIVEDEAKRDLPVQFRSFYSLEKDQAARQAAAENWDEYLGRQEGLSAVAGARYSLSLKAANAPEAAASQSMQESRRALGVATQPAPSSPSASGKERLAGYAEQSQFIAGKQFFLTGEAWLDSEVQRHADAPRIKISFNSPEYFALLRKLPDAGAWLAIGPRVQFYFQGSIYEITE